MKKTRARGRITVDIGGTSYIVRMSQSGLTIRAKWARHEATMTFHDLLDHAEGQTMLQFLDTKHLTPRAGGVE